MSFVHQDTIYATFPDGSTHLDMVLGSTIYRYFNVPPEVMEAFRAAESKGEFFNEFVKEEYEYSVIGPAEFGDEDDDDGDEEE